MRKILVIDDDPLIRKTFISHLSKEGNEVIVAADGTEGIELFKESNPDLTILDVRLPDINGLEVLTEIKNLNKKAYVIVMTAYDDMKTTVEAIKLGAFEYIAKPIDYIELSLAIKKVFKVKELEEKLNYIVEEQERDYTINNIIGKSPKMREVFKLIGMVANTRTNVLIQGESGTGKELVARAIHYSSPYKNEPFITINCSALPDTLLESELFGHVKGAFTDAVTETKGKFEIAGKGTLFLDEIGDISPNLQSKLLRVIETRDFMKVGGDKILKTEARIIAATNKNLKELVEQGKFREDLYYRLKVVEINLPPLRERKEDIPELVAYLLEKINRQLHKNVRIVPPHVMEKLINYPWKGNVRELENALTRAVVLSKSDVLLEENLPLEPSPQPPFKQELLPLKEVEKDYIQYVLKKVGGNKSKACRILKITRPTLDRKIKEYDIKV
ncbi:sigma-54 dependent transcriptional regulator [Candidatus Aminicenantes bacterium AC-335-K20]|jgi:two-component system response regulator AtoC|nr:sigma-54 dependent transcriptional regulator [SCandidatus Aminicenantes bacterium Aminicenantia_JdfR_composite]MCP2596966.1 sigma-54 dependent transcriptional regulator [Candidatus Aminicenantes bacterium AC-335-G13]MCP2605942.1 sigma-54 dependent transcriptional regulator [Candidatus Aminicenantes bacterium AC-708-I09]MCP2618281.1 sigma-54 dependent transcriptional regulator [Candidatus Aminicenantes bacterium AC-335-A11]MCP2619564.1 sigma-54 dependent transcriptional regulator [Candidatus 